MISIGIIGNGFAGNATSNFSNNYINVNIYDSLANNCKPLGITLQELCIKSDIIFICLPTPISLDGSCNTTIIEDAVKSISNYIDLDIIPVVIRSTVPVGISRKLNCFFIPDFLTEQNAINDFKNSNCWIFGLKERNIEQNLKARALINEIVISNYLCKNISHKGILFVDTKEAEAIKLFKNTFLAMKVGFCNEFYQFCQGNNINYNNVINGVITDNRITKSHTMVPGKDGKLGFSGTSFPKNISSLQNQMLKLDVKSPIINAVIKRNNEIDRVEHEWKSDEGRAFINS